jgi:uroporphyrinogen-III synthase
VSSLEEPSLLGWRVVVTRSRHQASALSDRLREAGAEPVEVPTIEIVPAGDGGAALASALARLGEFDWIAFSSANAVESVLAVLGGASKLASTKVAAVGKATAGALSTHGVRADLVPAVAVAEELAAAFGPAPAGGAAVLLPQAAGARPALAAGLEALGYRVEVAEAYRTAPAREAGAGARLEGADAVCFSSSSTVEGFISSYGREALPPVVVTIGPITSATAHKLGVSVDAEAAESSVDGVVAALAELARSRGKPTARG